MPGRRRAHPPLPRAAVEPYWATTIAKADAFIKAQPPDAAIPAQSTPTPDVLFDDRYELELGGTRFECISTPGGETLDSMVIWMPDRGVAFVGNVFSALFGHFPNLVTLRADRLRFALPFVDAVQTVIDLEPELLCTGHFDPISGAATIRAELTRLRDAVQYVHDETVAGHERGQGRADAHARDPAARRALGRRGLRQGRVGCALDLGGLRGLVPRPLDHRAVRHAGRRRVAGGGGAGRRTGRGGRRGPARIAVGEGIEAVQLCEMALAAEPGHRGALEAFVTAHELLLERHGGENFWLIGWLRDQVAHAQASIAGS